MVNLGLKREERVQRTRELRLRWFCWGLIPVFLGHPPLPTQVSDFMLQPRLVQLSASESMVFK